MSDPSFPSKAELEALARLERERRERQAKTKEKD